MASEDQTANLPCSAASSPFLSSEFQSEAAAAVDDAVAALAPSELAGEEMSVRSE